MKKENKNNFTDLDILRFIKFSKMVEIDESLKPLLDKVIEKEELNNNEEK
jgi:hypothetical protein